MRIVSRATGDGQVHVAVRASGMHAWGTRGAGDAGATQAGRPVLLIHGMGGDHRTWRTTAAALRATGRPVLSVDLRGHGRSSHVVDGYRLDDFADDLRHVLDAYAVDEVDVVGHSLGAQAAVRLTMAEPQRIRRLVLEEIPPMPRDEADLAEGITAGANLGEWLGGVAWLLRDPRPVLRADRTVGQIVGRQFEMADPGWWDRLAALPTPTLVISGGPNSFLPPRYLRAVADALPDGHFQTIATGHSVHRDKAAEFARAVLDFLA